MRRIEVEMEMRDPVEGGFSGTSMDNETKK
jgi:hypothetical protein